jgi:hypothetical protein
LLDEDMLGDDLEAWLAESALMKRTFRTCAIIAGLIERRFPGKEKSRREVTISTDLVYDVLRKHQGDHILLRAARADAASGLLDIRRLGEMLSRIKGRIVHKALDHVRRWRSGHARDRPRAGPWRGGGNAAAEAEAELVRDDAVRMEAARQQGETAGAEIAVAGVAFVADCAGALYWPEEGILAVADLHLEKGSSFAARRPAAL